ncbi:MAG: type I DNA topoisomerase [Gemmatimonadetes bacterium]|nr:type I DNA topoisomerase [Gemmatimonadota bacterium]MCA9767549.1 type I DNA topoisomerase [Gemmatimonadota bacterium]MCB9504808.1 type I DNA topoisomerase [Gemmatimonadales bacterium]MCB9518946.1 type I DNA topoisomerase [Gemmatimonadales bacterium]HRX18984.1 type I DNA topoisomerase [Gemmatimonadales bacterium]
MVSRRRAPTGLGPNALVIVESPTKARTIRGFLPDGFTVAASMGHVRDLPGDAKEIPAKYKGEEWARFGVNVDQDFEPLYIVPADKRPVVRELKELLKDADVVYLATDEDREGESISWHLLELLQPKVPVRRMVFHEITREAIQAALTDTREVDQDLVRAQETRRILDRLVGYTLSPLLWKKVAFGLSAGRVQSVATRLIVDRERERLAFRTGSYWDLKAELEHATARFEADLVSLGGKRLAVGKDFDEQTGRIADGKDVLLLGEAEAVALVARLKDAAWKVLSVEETPRTLKPYAPFTTSTLQQEANRKLRFGAKRTMQVAQKLYENGHITYMRTDSTALSEQAVVAARNIVKRLYGDGYLPAEARRYANKVANAQEAHEAIRPAGSTFRTPDETGLSGDEFALYDLIWKRTVASQMKDAKKTGTTVELAALDAVFKATGQRTDFPGFLRAYVEGSDDPDAALEDRDTPLPPLAIGDAPTCLDLEPVGHETKPPARYTEASLVKALEENGVGRPSTYASIIGTIQDRGYVVRQGQALVPTFTAFAVTDLLKRHFGNLVDVTFTKAMETRLDEIAGGSEDWLAYLRQFYLGDSGLRALTARGEEEIKPSEARTVGLDGMGAAIRIGRFGPYAEREENGELLRASLPKDATPADLDPERIDALIRQRAEGPESIGVHPETGDKIYLLDGQYGPYVQLGEGEGKQKPKRSSLPKGVKPEDVTLDLAVGLLSLPRVLGTHPDTGNTVKAGLGRFGPFVVHAKGGTEGKDDFRSLKAGDDVLTVTLDRALELLREPKGIRGQRAAATPLRTIGSHPKDGEPVHLFDGRYGPYVKHGDLNASLPKGADPQAFTLDEAVRLIAEKGKPPKGKRRSAKASTARTSTAKKSTAKKSTSRKTTKRAKKSTKRSST